MTGRALPRWVRSLIRRLDPRRHGGTVAAAVAAAGFAAGSIGAYRMADRPHTPPVILRQAIESEAMSSFDATPGSGGGLVLLRNDSTTPVEVTDAAFSRTTAVPPLYIAPETVPPGGEVNVYVPLPGACRLQEAFPAYDTSAPPVRVQVIAHVPGTPERLVPVEITGEMAAIFQNCRQQQGQ